MITHIVGYLLCASVVFFFEVIFPLGLLGLIALALYALAIFKAWVYFGLSGALVTLFAGVSLAFFTAYWELRMLPKTRLGRINFIKERLDSHSKLSEPTVELVGKEGFVVSDLLAGGQIKIEKKTYAAESISGPLSVGERVRVVEVGLRGVKVEKV